jgi:hypothetical protein
MDALRFKHSLLPLVLQIASADGETDTTLAANGQESETGTSLSTPGAAGPGSSSIVI